MNPVETTPQPASTPPRRSQPGEPPWEIARLFPYQGAWTEDDYLALNTNRMVELSDGCLEVLPMPTIFHQLLVVFLFKQLTKYVETNTTGFVCFAPLPVRLWSGKFREPDVIYLRPHRIASLHGQPDGADLVMEVVSEGPENHERDLIIKRQEYSQAGISEYWIVDPEPQRITVLTLDGTTYREHGIFANGDRATSVLLPGFGVAVAEVFAAGQPTL